MKKEKLYVILVLLILVTIIILSILKITKSKDIEKNEIESYLSNSSWVKISDEYHRELDTEYKDELIINNYFDINNNILRFCVFTEEESSCNEYNYLIENENINIYLPDNNILIYSIEIIDDDNLVMVENGDGYIRKYYYERAKG